MTDDHEGSSLLDVDGFADEGAGAGRLVPWPDCETVRPEGHCEGEGDAVDLALSLLEVGGGDLDRHDDVTGPVEPVVGGVQPGDEAEPARVRSPIGDEVEVLERQGYDNAQIAARALSSLVRVDSIDDEAMSKNHAVFEFSDSSYRIRDLASTNGTLLNGSEIRIAELKHGDRIQMGEHVFQLVLEKRESCPRTYMLPDA